VEGGGWEWNRGAESREEALFEVEHFGGGGARRGGLACLNPNACRLVWAGFWGVFFFNNREPNYSRFGSGLLPPSTKQGNYESNSNLLKFILNSISIYVSK
jgi:hypothetical protein